MGAPWIARILGPSTASNSSSTLATMPVMPWPCSSPGQGPEGQEPLKPFTIGERLFSGRGLPASRGLLPRRQLCGYAGSHQQRGRGSPEGNTRSALA